MSAIRRCLIAVFMSAIFSTAHSQSQTPTIAAAQETNSDLLIPAPKQFITHHTTTVRGQKIAYTAIAGETYLSTNLGETIGSIFSFSYIKEGPVDRKRPVVFIFNGGPASSSLWLHMGIMGPKRVALDNEINSSNLPPFGYTENPYSLLDVADLVIIDAIGTGFSRALGRAHNEDFFGVDQDTKATAQFIDLWLTANNRWTSPKFLVGESYGGLRASVLPRALMGEPHSSSGVLHGITLNGVILISSNIGPIRTEQGAPETIYGREMDVAQTLPALADTAWYYNRIDRKGRSIEAFDAEVTQFALGAYVDALRKQTTETLSADERRSVVAKLVEFSGLPSSTFEKDLNFELQSAANLLLADRGLNVGSLDGRYTLPAAHSAGEGAADDPAMARYAPGFVAAFHEMLANDLKVKMDRPYVAFFLERSWQWKREGPEDRSYADDLVTAMRRTPGMQVFVANGYYDLNTPPMQSRQGIEHAQPPRDRIQFKVYESGHMLYLGQSAAQKFSEDVRNFLLRASMPRPEAR